MSAKHKKQSSKHPIDLRRLSFLLSGRREMIHMPPNVPVARDDGHPYFSAWMRAWSRTVVIARVLAAIRNELSESARRTQAALFRQWNAPPPGWSLAPDTSKAQIDEALLAIDVFPRAAVLLLIFEGLPIGDAAALLNSEAALVRKAQAIAVRDLTSHLARQSASTGA